MVGGVAKENGFVLFGKAVWFYVRYPDNSPAGHFPYW